MLRAWRRRHLYDPSRPLMPWLFTIARRIVIDNHRRTGVTQPCSDIPEGPSHPVFSVCPDVAYERQELGNAIVRAYESLPDRHRRVLQLRFLDGASYTDIAAVERTSVVAVKPLLHRARASFRGAFTATGVDARLSIALAPIGALCRRVRAATFPISRMPHGPLAEIATTAVVTVAIMSATVLDPRHVPSQPRDQLTPAVSQPSRPASVAEPQRPLQPLRDAPTFSPASASGQYSPRTGPSESSSHGQAVDVRIADDSVEISDRVVTAPPTSRDTGTSGETSLRCVDSEAHFSPGCQVLTLVAAVSEVLAPSPDP